MTVQETLSAIYHGALFSNYLQTTEDPHLTQIGKTNLQGYNHLVPTVYDLELVLTGIENMRLFELKI